MKPKTFLIILLTGSILFSAYTMTLPWLHINPGISAAFGWGNSVNDMAADGLSALTGILEGVLGHYTDSGPSDWLKDFRNALKDEKELVDILSEGDCTPYGFSRIMTMLGKYWLDRGEDTLYFLALGYGFYAVILLGFVAFAAACAGRFGWSALYSAGLAIYLAAVYTMAEAVNGMFNAVLVEGAEGWTMALISAGLIFFFFICSGFVPAGSRSSAGETSRAESGDPYENRTERGAGQGPGPFGNDSGDDPWTWTVPDPDQMGEAESRAAEAPKAPRKKMRRPDAGMVLAVVLLGLGIAAAAAFALNRKPAPVSIDLAEYLQVDVSGFDGYGTVQDIFDWETFHRDLKARMEEQAGKIRSKGQGEQDTAADAERVLADMDVSISRSDHLSNGDTLQPEATLGEGGRTLLEAYYVQLETEKFTEPITVEGLKPIVSYNPIEDVEIIFDGAEPYGEAYVFYNGDYDDALYVDASPSQGLRNGDTVTVTVSSYFDEEALKEYYGIELTQTEKTEQVSGLKYYPDSIGDFSDQDMEQIVDQARDIAVSNIRTEYKSDEQMAGLTSLGQILAASDADNAQIRNHLFCLFRVSYANTSGDSRSYIYFVGFRNIMKDPVSGELSFNSSACLVPQKPDFITDTLNMDLNLAEFVMVRLLPPRILSGFSSAEGFYRRYVSPLEDTCTVTASGSDLEELTHRETDRQE